MITNEAHRLPFYDFKTWLEAQEFDRQQLLLIKADVDAAIASIRRQLTGIERQHGRHPRGPAASQKGALESTVRAMGLKSQLVQTVLSGMKKPPAPGTHYAATLVTVHDGDAYQTFATRLTAAEAMVGLLRDAAEGERPLPSFIGQLGLNEELAAALPSETWLSLDAA